MKIAAPVFPMTAPRLFRTRLGARTPGFVLTREKAHGLRA